MSVVNLSKGGLNEIVFENRNKSYGAYKMREQYNERILIAFFLTAVSVILFVLLINFLPKKKSIISVVIPEQEDVIIFKKEIVPVLPEETPIEPVTPSSPKKPDHQLKEPLIVDKIDSLAKNPDPGKNPDPQPGPSGKPGGTPGGSGTRTEKGCIDCVPEKPATPVEIASFMPEFKGGFEKMKEFIEKNIQIPELLWDIGGTHKAYIYAIVAPDGTLYDVKILMGSNNQFNKAALKVVEKMPKWNPGKLKTGETIPVIVKIPIVLNLG